MATRIALGLIVSAVLAIAVAFGATLVSGTAAGFVAWALAYGIGASMTGMFVLGAIRRGRLARGLALTFGIVLVVVVGAFWLALGLPPNEMAGGPLLLGLPLRTGIVMYGVGVIPMFLLPLVYAVTFDDGILNEADIEEVRAARRRMVEGEPS